MDFDKVPGPQPIRLFIRGGARELEEPMADDELRRNLYPHQRLRPSTVWIILWMVIVAECAVILWGGMELWKHWR